MSAVSGKKIVSSMFWRFGEKITSQGVSFFISIILARILAPDDYGIVAIVSVFIAIAEVFVTSGLGTALVQKKNATKSEFSTVFWINLLLSFVIYSIVFLGAPIIARAYDDALLIPVIRVFALRIPLNSVNSVQNAYVSKRMEFKKFFWATIIGTILSAIVGITLALNGFGVWALVLQMLTNTVIDTIVLFLIIEWRPTKEFSVTEAKPLISYGIRILATDLIGTIFNNLNSFVIGTKYTATDLAYYTQGRKAPDLISNNIENTLSAVLFPAMALCDNTDEIVRIRRKSLKMMGFCIFPLMFGMLAIAENFVLVLYTDKWIFIVPYIRIACIVSVINVMGSTLIQETKAIGRSDMTLKMELLKKPIFLLVLIIAMRHGVMAIALCSIVNAIVAFGFNVYPVRKLIGYDFVLHIKDEFPQFAISVIMFIVVYILGFLVDSQSICLVVQILLGGVIYLSLSYLFKIDSMMDILRILKLNPAN